MRGKYEHAPYRIVTIFQISIVLSLIHSETEFMQKSIKCFLVYYEGKDMNTSHIKMSESVISNIVLSFISTLNYMRMICNNSTF
jgi:hypothetical protein